MLSTTAQPEASSVVARAVAISNLAPIPVIGRISDGTLYFDLRTLDDEQAFVAQLDKLHVVAG